MSNPYRVSAATQSGCISKGNFQIGAESIDFGPTGTTNFYAGITPPTGGYAWYKASGLGAHIRTAANDQTLVNIVNEELGLGFTQASAAIRYINTQTNQYVTNITYPAIPTAGLTLLTDIGYVASYPKEGITASSVDSYTGKSLTASQAFLNGPTYTSNYGGGMLFDGVDDGSFMNDQVAPYGVPQTAAFTLIVILRSTQTNWNQNGIIASNRYNNGFIIHPDIGTKNVRFYLSGSSGSAVFLGSHTPADITIPHMYTLSTNGTNSHKWYLDGGSPSTSSTVFTRADTTREWFVGTEWYLSRYGAVETYVTLYYNRQLTDQEVLDVYNAYKPRFGW